MHFLLQLKGLLELLLQIVEVGLGLVTLTLQELVSAFPEGLLLIKQSLLLLEFSCHHVMLTSELLVAIGIDQLGVFVLLGELHVLLLKVLDFCLIVANELFSFVFQVLVLLDEDSAFRFSLGCLCDQAFLDVLELSTFGLVFGFSGFFLLLQPGRSVLDLSLHFFLVHLYPVLIPRHSPIVLCLHLLQLLVRERDLLLHQCLFLLEINVLLVQFVLFFLESLLEIGVLMRHVGSFSVILFLSLVGKLVLCGNLELEGINLILEGNLGTLQLGDL